MDIELESLMKNKFINLSAILAIILLSACETTSQKVVSGSAATSVVDLPQVQDQLQVQVQLIKNRAYLLKPNKQLLIN